MEESYPDVRMTPYEKNFEVWRQLWRVVERSDLIVQIVDCRDPFFYRCDSLEEWIQSINKKSLLILNKSDLVPANVRALLSEELNEKKINHIFFSALLSAEETNQQTSTEIMPETNINSP